MIAPHALDGSADQDSLQRLVADLGAAETGRLVNPYACHDPELDRLNGAAIRRTNLLAYLEERPSPAFLLVGEAAGYRGCRFSGIAFTSERCLAPEQWSSRCEQGWIEPSATIVHGELSLLGLESRTLLWNAVPFHPIIDGQPLSNRTPIPAELKAREEWLARLIALTQPGLAVAIGRKATKSLKAVHVGALSVRHPARGGAKLFREQLRAIVGGRELA
jgi:uracil-DNA glycosylase